MVWVYTTILSSFAGTFSLSGEALRRKNKTKSEKKKKHEGMSRVLFYGMLCLVGADDATIHDSNPKGKKGDKKRQEEPK